MQKILGAIVKLLGTMATWQLGFVQAFYDCLWVRARCTVSCGKNKLNGDIPSQTYGVGLVAISCMHSFHFLPL